ncbi:MAG: TolC family protein, partial [Magnetococcales bacterium]|nr:TolC family protein [Magnetococcales bacterium]
MATHHRKPIIKITGRTLLMCAVLLSGCAVKPKELTVQELDSQRRADLSRMFHDVAPVAHPLTLAEVVARALRHNLDHQVKMVEEAQALDLTGLDRFELLPKLVLNAAHSSRSNVAASSSQSVTTGSQSLELSTSQDRDRITRDLSFSWNILDFAVSYFNARQNANRHLIARERERKVVQNLIQEARSAFWRAAAAQQLGPRIAETIRIAEGALVDARKAEASELRSPLESLQYRKILLENLRQLETMQQEMATAQVELAAMMTLPPGTRFTLAVPDGPLQIPVWNTPLDKMEEMALLNQADMREMTLHGRIVVDESRKALLKLFPGISLSASRQRDSNSFTLNNDWYESGLRVTWNLLGLLSAPTQMTVNKTNEEVIGIKRLALSMALLSQVHMANRQFEQALLQLRRSDELFQVEKAIAGHVANKAAQEAQSVLDRISSDSTAILAELRRYNALALAQNALGKMMASTGQDPDVEPIHAGSLEELTVRVSQWLAKQGTTPPPAPQAARPAPAPVVTAAKEAATVSSATMVRKGPGTRYERV